MDNKKLSTIIITIFLIIISSFIFDLSKPKIINISKDNIINNTNNQIKENINNSNIKSNFIFLTNVINSDIEINNKIIKTENKLDFENNKIILINKFIEKNDLNLHQKINNLTIFDLKENNLIIELNYLQNDIQVIYTENNYFIKDLYLLYLSGFIVLIAFLLAFKYFYDIIYKIKEDDLINSVK